MHSPALNTNASTFTAEAYAIELTLRFILNRKSTEQSSSLGSVQALANKSAALNHIALFRIENPPPGGYRWPLKPSSGNEVADTLAREATGNGIFPHHCTRH